MFYLYIVKFSNRYNKYSSRKIKKTFVPNFHLTPLEDESDYDLFADENHNITNNKKKRKTTESTTT